MHFVLNEFLNMLRYCIVAVIIIIIIIIINYYYICFEDIFKFGDEIAQLV